MLPLMLFVSNSSRCLISGTDNKSVFTIWLHLMFSKHINASFPLIQPVWTRHPLWLPFLCQTEYLSDYTVSLTSSRWEHLAMLMEHLLISFWSLCTMRTSQLIWWLMGLTFPADRPRPTLPQDGLQTCQCAQCFCLHWTCHLITLATLSALCK